jgi:hypothetical protein
LSAFGPEQTDEWGATKLTVILRKGEAADADAVGDICYRAFKALAESHNFTPDIPSADVATHMLAGLISHEDFIDLVAEIDGRIVGSNFLDERNPISGVGHSSAPPRHSLAPAFSCRRATESCCGGV